MPGKEFFARMAPQFAEHAGSARDTESRQTDVKRLIAKAEYECCQVRRELTGLIPGISVLLAEPEDAVATPGSGVPAPAKAA